MKKSLKGALLSGLFFPGAGQLWLRRYWRGTALIAAVSACLAVVVRQAGQQALTILEKMESEGSAVDMVALFRSACSKPDDPLANWASAALVFCWIAATVDAYFLGKRMDEAD